MNFCFIFSTETPKLILKSEVSNIIQNFYEIPVFIFWKSEMKESYLRKLSNYKENCEMPNYL